MNKLHKIIEQVIEVKIGNPAKPIKIKFPDPQEYEGFKNQVEGDMYEIIISSPSQGVKDIRGYFDIDFEDYGGASLITISRDKNPQTELDNLIKILDKNKIDHVLDDDFIIMQPEVWTKYVEGSVNEIKVDKPNSITKQQVLDYFFNYNVFLLSMLTRSKDVQELIDNDGYNNLNDYLMDNYGYDGDKLKEVKIYINSYFKYFKPSEIYVATFGDGSGVELRNMTYPNIDITYNGNNEYVLYAYN